MMKSEGETRRTANLRMELDQRNHQLQFLQNTHTTDPLTPESVNQSHVPDYFQCLTGFTHDQFNSLCEFFKVSNNPKAPRTESPVTYKTDIEIQNMPQCRQLLLTLMKLRQNLDHKDLAFRFHIPLQSASTLFNSWIDYMYDRLGQLPIWPHRDVITQNMPAHFKQDFPNTFAILDGTELKIEKPSSLLLQSQTYST